MTDKEATRLVYGTLPHGAGSWTVFGKNVKQKGMAVSCSVKGDEKTALEAWQIKFPDYVPLKLTRFDETKGRMVGKYVNKGWKFGDPHPSPTIASESPTRRRRRRTTQHKTEAAPTQPASDSEQPRRRRRRRRRQS